MFQTHDTKKHCCTCNHWRGTRIREKSGDVFTMMDIEGICNGVKLASGGVHLGRPLTFPDTRCDSWEKLPETGLS